MCDTAALLKSRTFAWGSLFLAWTALGIGLWHYSVEMAPVTQVSGDVYWKQVLGLDEYWGRAYLPRDGWFIGAQSGFHGEHLFQVPEPQAREAFKELAPKIAALPPRQIEYVQKGIDAWLEKDRARTDPVLLLSCIHQAHLDIYQNQAEMQEYVRSRERFFDMRWKRIKRCWVNIVLEGAYLGALVLFLHWPWLRCAARWRWGLHLGLCPLLLFAPYHLGYAMLTFTTAAQPGGLLYSQLLVWFRQPILWLIGGWNRELPWTALDGWLIATLPKPLEPISQTPGPMMAISGGGGVGPVFLLKLGALIAVAIYAGPLLVRIAKKHITATSSNRSTPSTLSR